MGFNSNLFGIITAGIGLVCFVQLLSSIVRYFRPSRVLAGLDKVLDETHSMLDTAVEECLLDNHGNLHAKLLEYHHEVHDLRNQTYCSYLMSQEVKAVFCGLSYRIQTLYNKVHRLRGTISTEIQIRRKADVQRSGGTNTPELSFDAVSRLSLSSASASSQEATEESSEPCSLGDSDMQEKNGNTADKTITIVSSHEADVGIGIPHVEHPPVVPKSNPALQARHAPRVKRPRALRVYQSLRTAANGL